MGADEWDDPHGLIPEEFREEYGDCETVADALRKVECAPSTTPADDRPRCPECGSSQVSVKPSTIGDHPERRDGRFRCAKQGCRVHFDQPADESAIPMTDDRTNPFDWIDDDDQHDADERTALDPPLAGIDRETAVEVAVRLREPWRDAEGPSYTEIARYLPFADSWVGHRVREWRDGEHRELVPDPSVDTDPITVDDSGATAVATDGGRRRWDAYGSD